MTPGEYRVFAESAETEEHGGDHEDHDQDHDYGHHHEHEHKNEQPADK